MAAAGRAEHTGVTAPRFQLADELLRRFSATVRSTQLYSKGHPIITRNLDALGTAVQLLHSLQPSIVIGIVGEEVVVDDTPMARIDTLGGIVRRMRDIGVERVTIDRGVTRIELSDFLDAISAMETPREADEPREFPPLPHIRVGRVSVTKGFLGTAAEMAAVQRIYSSALAVAQQVWDSADTEGVPDPSIARRMIDGLAHAASKNRSSILALTTLKNYDNYTFTHMVNVSILTMAQARALGIDGALLREFGLAALMHDIGKVRTPTDILNKPDAFTPQELEIMKRHTVDGAEILRKTPDVPALAPVVAFEHHLRLDGSGYPDGVTRLSLNLGTMLCSIADVYDAMRSQRHYQKAFPTDRILAVLKRNDGQQFDQHLVRRFVQLLGVYPVGNLVRLNTGEIAVVVTTYAPDPYRPHVRVLFDKEGKRLETTYSVNLWDGGPGMPKSIVSPVDPADYDIDPLTLI